MNKKILVIDDDPDLVDKIREKLEADYYEVLGAFDGLDGLAKTKTDKPDLIILDLVMPKMTGLEFVNELKLYPDLRNIPIILMTEHISLLKFFPEELLEHYIVKPIQVPELRRLVRYALGDVEAKTVLVIDDDPAVISALKTHLMHGHYVVWGAENGKEALDIMKSRLPNIIILDIFMPVMNGFEFLKALKKNEAWETIPVIVLLEREAMRDYVEGLQVDEIMLKPFTGEDATAKIQFLLESKAMILCDNDDVTKAIVRVFEERLYMPVLVRTEEEMMTRIKKYKYKSIVAYLGAIKKEPHEFISDIRSTVNKNTLILIYCNPKVPQAEKDNIIVLRNLRRKWLEAKADDFFDIRISESDFPVLFEKCEAKKKA